jgi:hypothetical protein
MVIYAFHSLKKLEAISLILAHITLCCMSNSLSPQCNQRAGHDVPMVHNFSAFPLTRGTTCQKCHACALETIPSHIFATSAIRVETHHNRPFQIGLTAHTRSRSSICASHPSTNQHLPPPFYKATTTLSPHP